MDLDNAVIREEPMFSLPVNFDRQYIGAKRIPLSLLVEAYWNPELHL